MQNLNNLNQGWNPLIHLSIVRLTIGLAAIGALLVASTAHANSPAWDRPPGLCDAAAVESALASALSGDVVRIGACRVEGPFTVPPGVTLRGIHPFASIIEVSGEEPGVQLFAGAQATGLRNLGIDSDARAAVLVSDAGRARIENVVVHSTRGVGIAAEGVTSLYLEQVRLRGPVTPDNAADIDPAVATPEVIATHGLVAVAVDDLRLKQVHTRGFAVFGALLVESNTSWWGGAAVGNVATGLMVHGGAAQIRRVNVSRNLRGGGDHAAGLGVAAGAMVTTRNLRAFHNEGYGSFHSEAGGVEHTGLWAGGNERSAVWYQDGEYVQVDNAVLIDNHFAGIVALNSTLAEVSEISVVRTRPGSPIADGIHVVNTFLDIRDATLLANERAGILSKVEGEAPCLFPEEHITAENVRIAGGGDSLGAIFQDNHGTTKLVTEGIQRFGSIVANDNAFLASPTPLGVAEGGVPCLLPRALEVAVGGLDVLLDGGVPGDPL